MKIARTAQLGLIVAITAAFALPLYLAVVNVFKTQDQILYQPVALPNPFTLKNMERVLSRPDHLVFNGVLTSLGITAAAVIGIIFFSSVIGYYLARSKTPLARLLHLLFAFGMMVPPHVTLIPVVRLFNTLGLMGTYPGVILFFVGGGMLSFGVFVYTGFVKNIPRELEEAAIIDGADEFRMFWQIIFPLLRPATATVAIFVSLWTWNEFLIPLLILGPARGNTITTGVYLALGQLSSIDYGQMFSMMFLASLPMLLLFFFLQREFIDGLAQGALKG
jgi:raffinose/stachyose/melibiose transport system permease protein